MRDLLFPSSPVHRGALAESARLAARAFVMECRAVVGMYETCSPGEQEFVHGDVAGTLHLAPRTAQGKACTALALMAQPRLVTALETGRLTVPHAMSLLDETSHLDQPTAEQVLAAVLEQTPLDDAGLLDATPGELRKAAKRAAIMSFDDPELTAGQREVAALLHVLGCDRVAVQAVLECPVERAVDLHAVAGAGVWGVDVRMPIAVALGLSDHPALLAGYGPIDADQARALLPAADLVKACVDAGTGEVLAVDRPVRAKPWQAGDPDQAQALRSRLIAMATSVGTMPDLTTDGYIPSEALGRLVDLRQAARLAHARPPRRQHHLDQPQQGRLHPTPPAHDPTRDARRHHPAASRRRLTRAGQPVAPSSSIAPSSSTHRSSAVVTRTRRIDPGKRAGAAYFPTVTPRSQPTSTPV